MLFLVMLSCLLAGCAQYQMQQMLAQKQQEEAGIKIICAQDSANPGLDSIRSQIPADAREASVTQLSDSRYATPQQKDAIAHIDDYYLNCHNSQSAYFNKYYPNIVPIFEDEQQKMKALRAKLWAEKITFGEYNTARAQEVSTANQRLSHAAQSQQLQAEQLDLQRRQTNAAILNALRPSVPAYTPPIMTSCYRSGQMVNCTTQ